MIYRTLGRTGLRVGGLVRGRAGVGAHDRRPTRDANSRRCTRARARASTGSTPRRATATAQSEANLGRVLAELGAAERVHVATKVRVPPEALDDSGDYVRRSVEESLQRLRVPRVTLLQLHNGITRARGDEPASITPRDILAAACWRRSASVRDEGLVQSHRPDRHRAPGRDARSDRLGRVRHDPGAVQRAEPERGHAGRRSNGETDYGNIIADCAAQRMGVFAIRVFAGGALLDQPPSAHTLKTPYFPLALYERDAERAKQLRERVAGRFTPAELAVRFALSHPAVSSAIIGFGSPAHVDEVARVRLDEPLPADLLPFG